MNQPYGLYATVYLQTGKHVNRLLRNKNIKYLSRMIQSSKHTTAHSEKCISGWNVPPIRLLKMFGIWTTKCMITG